MTDANIIPVEALQGKRLERHGFTFIERRVEAEPSRGLSGFINSLVSRDAQKARCVTCLNDLVGQMIEHHGAAFAIDQVKAVLTLAEQAEQEGK